MNHRPPPLPSPSPSSARRKSPIAPNGAAGASSASTSAWAWSSLQTLTSSVLGADPADTVKQRRPLPSSSSSPPGSSSSTTSSSTARRRRPPHAHKRATSPDPADAPRVEAAAAAERDILVYVHPVRATDTIEGVVIAFNIPPDSLRRANGLWRHDSVQSRRTLLLPVEECCVKGVVVEVPRVVVVEEEEEVVVVEGGGGGGGGGGRQGGQAGQGGRPYRHEKYVNITGIGIVEIARLSRKKLSHFPPGRRKPTTTTSSSSTTTTTNNTNPALSTSSPWRIDATRIPGLTRGVGDLHPHPHHHLHTTTTTTGGEAPFTLRALGEIAGETAAGLESIGGAVEGFVRKWTVRAGGFVGGELIELTQRLGFDDAEAVGGRRGGGVDLGRRETVPVPVPVLGGAEGSGRERRVVRERLTRGEGKKVL